MVRRAVKLTLIGLLAVSAMTLAPAVVRKTRASSDEKKLAWLDPELADAFRELQPANRVIDTNGGRIVQKGDAIRIVVNLKQPPTQTLTARGYGALEDVKRSVRGVQDRLLRKISTNDFQMDVRLDIQYAVAGWANQAGIRKLLSHPEVESIVPDYLNEMYTVEGRALTRSDNAANTLGYTGSGVTVAMVDTAYDYLHTELGASTPKSDSNPSGSNAVCKYMKDFSGDVDHTSRGDGLGPGAVTADDDVYPASFNDGYHGTGTAAIVHRYAPGAKLVLLKVFPNSFDSIIANAINWCVTNKNITAGAPIELINMSLGGGRNTGSCSAGTIQSAVDNAKVAGIVCFVAAGNDGWTDAMGSPACDPDVIAIGSVWDVNSAPYSPFPPALCSDTTRQQNERACYSDASPELDLYAPSEQVTTAQVFGGTFTLGGTSSATPAAAGLAAQLLHAKPALKGSITGIKSLFQSTGVPILGNPNSTYQNKRIDVTSAILGLSGPVINSFTASPSTVSPGGSSTLSWNCSNTTSVTISGVAGTFGAVGSTSVFPSATTTYTLTATGSATATASVTVTVSTGGGGNEVEPNGTTSTANVLGNGINTTGYISPHFDVDYFQITLAPRKIVTITMTPPPTKDYDLKLYSSSGTLLATSARVAGRAETITYQNPSFSFSRTYYIKVYGYGAGDDSATASYLIRATW